MTCTTDRPGGPAVACLGGEAGELLGVPALQPGIPAAVLLGVERAAVLHSPASGGDLLRYPLGDGGLDVGG
ncbi:hypothetical protein [Pseudofrankia sp. BMG5.37]|uniref:hypothetical protein n=1 Tax=Pseudofrankia sp. BMG5.37 TaxID=3050035 RepID=UPI002895B76A|nr:hypothetical protein [Pseudofrankia sp. BMG5.37]MDT3438357.1 hypothetical protein [Pseudofrankia sp. BMG5.37]